MQDITDETGNGEPLDDEPEAEPSELMRKLEAFDVTAYGSGSKAIAALIDMLDPQTPEDIARVLDMQDIRIDLLKFEMEARASERRAEIARQKAEEEARDKFGGRSENPRPRPAAPQSPKEAMRLIANYLTYVDGPIQQLADDAERATHIEARVQAGVATARLMQSAATLGTAINRIDVDSHRQTLEKLRRRDVREARDTSDWTRR